MLHLPDFSHTFFCANFPGGTAGGAVGRYGGTGGRKGNWLQLLPSVLSGIRECRDDLPLLEPLQGLPRPRRRQGRRSHPREYAHCNPQLAKLYCLPVIMPLLVR
mgnify:FL=1